jgi:ketosteroid isomerase-like protein
MSNTEQVIFDAVKQWESAWNLCHDSFSMNRFGELYVRDERLLAYDLTSPETPSIIRGYQQYAAVWEPFMQSFSPWNIKINDDLSIRTSDHIAVATFTWKIWGTAKADNQEITGNLHATLVFERIDEKWQIVHEHISTPVRDLPASNP